MYHSQSPEAYFAHTSGLVVVVPASPADAKGLLTSAIRGADPVLFLEPKRIYRAVKGEVPDGEHLVPIGKASTLRAGRDVSLLTYGAMVPVAERAAREAAGEDIDVEVIDLRTLVPLDREAVIGSVSRTGRLVILHEAPRTCGFGAELAALIAEKAVLSLAAPIERVTGYDTPFPYTLEHSYLPSAGRVLRAIRRVARF
jgi:2-oxoisovalerate dehydrogenase E1 component beta subunit